MIPVGLSFMVFYQYFIGTLAFKFQDIGFFRHVQGSVIAFLTGAIVPLALLPEAVTGALRFLPFTYVTYMPAMLLTGRAGAGEGLFGLAVIVAWTAAMSAVCQLTYNRLRVKFDGVGI
jgi:ABC-2 type transport system permease protein